VTIRDSAQYSLTHCSITPRADSRTGATTRDSLPTQLVVEASKLSWLAKWENEAPHEEARKRGSAPRGTFHDSGCADLMQT